MNKTNLNPLADIKRALDSASMALAAKETELAAERQRLNAIPDIDQSNALAARLRLEDLLADEKASEDSIQQAEMALADEQAHLGLAQQETEATLNRVRLRIAGLERQRDTLVMERDRLEVSKQQFIQAFLQNEMEQAKTAYVKAAEGLLDLITEMLVLYRTGRQFGLSMHSLIGSEYDVDLPQLVGVEHRKRIFTVEIDQACEKQMSLLKDFA